MRTKRRWGALIAALLACATTSRAVTSRPGTSVSLPEGAPGIGFDDLRYSAALHRVLAPSGRSGRLNLVDPVSLRVTSIAGFSARTSYEGGHEDGPTSVAEAGSRLWVTDRTSRTLVSVDPQSRSLGKSAPLGHEPDYVRFVAATGELWITEPDAERIEIMRLTANGTSSAAGTITVKNGPESLVVDERRGRAYTHRWKRSTLAIDVKTRAIVAEWPNGCSASRGIALDAARGFLFVACREGAVAVLDVAHDGHIVSTLRQGSGFDVIGYSQKLGHLYLAGGECGCWLILGVDSNGKLARLERGNAPAATHCATADDTGHFWVCDPKAGRLLRFDDTHPGSNG
jgi:DNA-binding beta-propeller fold protein YncE